MRKLTINAGKVPPSPLILNMIGRAVILGAFPWPETAWTKFLREVKGLDLTVTGRTPSQPELQELPA